VSDSFDFDAFLAAFQAVEARVDDEIAAALTALGRFNLLAVGDTGAGKSTLVNAMFGITDAETGIGRPVTMEIRRYPDNDYSIITVFDTRGFELGTHSRELIDGVTGLIRQRKGLPVQDQIHAVWFLVNSWTGRFQDAHAEVVTALHDMGLPVAIVFTRVPRLGSETDENALELARSVEERKLPLAGGGKVVLVNSVDLRQVGGTVIPQHGLDDLLHVTLDMAPVAAAAIRAGQRVDLTMQRAEAKKIIRNFRYVSAAAGLTAAAPLPAADIGAVGVAIAIMIAKISVCYGLPIRRAQIAAISAAAVLGVGAGKKGAGKAGKWIAESAATRVAGRATESVLGGAAKGGAEAIAKTMARRGAQETAKTIAGEIAKESAEQAAKAIAEQLAKEGTEQAAKAIAKEIAKEGAEQAAKATGGQVAKQGAKQVGKFIPVVSVVFGLVGAGSATLLAKAVGHAWMHACENFLKHPALLEDMEVQKILTVFWQYFERRNSSAPGDGPESAQPAL